MRVGGEGLKTWGLMTTEGRLIVRGVKMTKSKVTKRKATSIFEVAV
jgi:hypothetical protein